MLCVVSEDKDELMIMIKMRNMSIMMRIMIIIMMMIMMMGDNQRYCEQQQRDSKERERKASRRSECIVEEVERGRAGRDKAGQADDISISRRED